MLSDFPTACNYLVYQPVFFNAGQPVAEWLVTTKTYDTPENGMGIISACRQTNLPAERPLRGLAGPII